MNLIETLSNNPKFFIDPSLDFDDEKKSLLVDFIDFCKSELEISGGFKISLVLLAALIILIGIFPSLVLNLFYF